MSASTAGHAWPPTRRYTLTATAPMMSAVSDTISVVERQFAVWMRPLAIVAYFVEGAP